jgi:hypothetical protein
MAKELPEVEGEVDSSRVHRCGRILEGDETVSDNVLKKIEAVKKFIIHDEKSFCTAPGNEKEWILSITNDHVTYPITSTIIGTTPDEIPEEERVFLNLFKVDGKC